MVLFNFSCTVDSWIKILGPLIDNKEYSDEEVKQMTEQRKSEQIQKDPVTCTRNFEHMVQLFIHNFIKSSNSQTHMWRTYHQLALFFICCAGSNFLYALSLLQRITTDCIQTKLKNNINLPTCFFLLACCSFVQRSLFCKT